MASPKPTPPPTLPPGVVAANAAANAAASNSHKPTIPEPRLRHFVRSQALLGTTRSCAEEQRLVDAVDVGTIRQVCEEILRGKGALVMLGPAVSQLARPGSSFS